MEGMDDPGLYAQAAEINTSAQQKGSSHVDTAALVAKYGFSSVYEATGLVGRSSYPDTFSMELHLMTVDGVSFIFEPFEIFGVTGREIKDTSPYDMTFVITCSENSKGYHRRMIEENRFPFRLKCKTPGFPIKREARGFAAIGDHRIIMAHYRATT